ncbi:MAG: hypothetical protein NZM37_06390 [Sandaracinaceae bacterium]|nr:hypothetical protein [Sandaracinaceae bacterium]
MRKRAIAHKKARGEVGILFLISILITSLGVAGCNTAFIGHLLVLLVTVAIFIGTLNLGRPRAKSHAFSSGHGPNQECGSTNQLFHR